MPNYSAHPRILFVTPEMAFLPEGGGSRTTFIRADTDGFGNLQAELISNLLELGADVHVAQPDFRKIFAFSSRKENAGVSVKLPGARIHLAEDKTIFYSKPINSNSVWENIKISLAFQREVINQILPRVQPDLIHCYDWMTGLIPAAARRYNIPCLFSVQKFDTARSFLSYVEDRGIDAAAFWQFLYYDRYPINYEETRETNPLDFLLSGILAARHVSTTSFALTSEIFEGRSEFFYPALRNVLAQKWNAGCACVIPGSSNPPFNPAGHEKLYDDCGPKDQKAGEPKKNHVTKQRSFPFDDRSSAQRYIDLYETILQRLLVAPEPKKAPIIMKKSHTRISDGPAMPYRKVRSTQSNRIPNERIPTPAIAPL